MKGGWDVLALLTNTRYNKEILNPTCQRAVWCVQVARANWANILEKIQIVQWKCQHFRNNLKTLICATHNNTTRLCSAAWFSCQVCCSWRALLLLDFFFFPNVNHWNMIIWRESSVETKQTKKTFPDVLNTARVSRTISQANIHWMYFLFSKQFQQKWLKPLILLQIFFSFLSGISTRLGPNCSEEVKSLLIQTRAQFNGQCSRGPKGL